MLDTERSHTRILENKYKKVSLENNKILLDTKRIDRFEFKISSLEQKNFEVQSKNNDLDHLLEKQKIMTKKIEQDLKEHLKQSLDSNKAPILKSGSPEKEDYSKAQYDLDHYKLNL